MRSALAAVVLALMVGGCAETVSEVEPGEVFTLAPGQTVKVNGAELTIRFIEVAEDSRCPVDATCVWAGDAVVVVETVLRSVEQVFGLHSTPGTATGPGSVALDGFELTLVDVRPEPRAGLPIRPEDYRVTLRVER